MRIGFRIGFRVGFRIGRKSAAHFYYLKNQESSFRNSGCGQGVMSFVSGAGGQGGAADDYGVPVMWGMVGGSGTGDHFQGAVRFLAQAVKPSWGIPQKKMYFPVHFPGSMVRFPSQTATVKILLHPSTGHTRPYRTSLNQTQTRLESR